MAFQAIKTFKQKQKQKTNAVNRVFSYFDSAMQQVLLINLPMSIECSSNVLILLAWDTNIFLLGLF